MKTLIAIFLLGLVSFQAIAAGFVSATVVSIRIDQSGNGMVIFSQNIGGTPPSCVIDAYRNALAFNTNTEGGKSIYAMALVAKATGASIGVNGLGTCNIFGGYVEDWDYGLVQ